MRYAQVANDPRYAPEHCIGKVAALMKAKYPAIKFVMQGESQGL